MAQIYVPGPALIYVGDEGEGTFLGTGEQAPDVDVNGEYIPVMNDLAGTRLPFDRIWEGEEAQVSIAFNRFNWDVIRDLLARPSGGTPGLALQGDVGTLVNAEGVSFHLWLQWTYSRKAFQEGQIPDGFHFHAAMLTYPTKLSSGTKDQKVNCIFQCQRDFVAPGDASEHPPGSLILYDFDMSGIPPQMPD